MLKSSIKLATTSSRIHVALKAEARNRTHRRKATQNRQKRLVHSESRCGKNPSNRQPRYNVYVDRNDEKKSLQIFSKKFTQAAEDSRIPKSGLISVK